VGTSKLACKETSEEEKENRSNIRPLWGENRFEHGKERGASFTQRVSGATKISYYDGTEPRDNKEHSPLHKGDL